MRKRKILRFFYSEFHSLFFSLSFALLLSAIFNLRIIQIKCPYTQVMNMVLHMIQRCFSSTRSVFFTVQVILFLSYLISIRSFNSGLVHTHTNIPAELEWCFSHVWMNEHQWKMVEVSLVWGENSTFGRTMGNTRMKRMRTRKMIERKKSNWEKVEKKNVIIEMMRDEDFSSGQETNVKNSTFSIHSTVAVVKFVASTDWAMHHKILCVFAPFASTIGRNLIFFLGPVDWTIFY